MTRTLLLAAAALAALPVAGCTETVASRGAGPAVVADVTPAPNSSAAGWKMPWQISPIGANAASDEELTTAYVPETGMVRGTRQALASIGRPLPAASGPNRTVDACRAVVEGEATKIGAREVEAVSGGAQRRNAKGQYVAPVRMRITYARPNGYEVREAMMTCIVDARGKIVDAYV